MISSVSYSLNDLRQLLEIAETPDDIEHVRHLIDEYFAGQGDDVDSLQDDGEELTERDIAGGRALEYERRKSEEIRDIGPPPAVADEAAKRVVSENLEEFLKRFFPSVFNWPFSQDQRESLSRMDYIVDRGGLQVIADPRGTGKTQRALRTAIKAILTGKRKYVCLVAATDKKAKSLIKAARTILGYNEELYRLFPNEIHGFPQLRGSNKKAQGQICCGVETAIHFGADKIIFPTITGSVASGAVISSCGITGDVRGQFHTRQDGAVIRPDLILIDDPQTKESAGSPDQTQERLEIIEGDILGMAAPDTAMACVALCTVIEKGDLSDRLLSLQKWHGKRTKTINVMPTNMAAWDKYFEDISEAERIKEPERINAAYLASRDVLDEGCVVAWEHKKEQNDVSAIQSAMHLLYRCGPTAFAAEYQNEPLDNAAGTDQPTFSGLDTKLTQLERGVVPVWATKLTMGIDVQGRLLFWAVVAWADDMTCSVVDYGAWPEQSRGYFTLGDAAPTLQQASGLSQLPGALHWGMTGLMAAKLGKSFIREGGGEISIGRAVVDANWGESTDVVYEFCRRSTFGGILVPSHGRGIKAGDKPMNEWASKPTETHGWHWVLTPGDGKRAVRHVVFDTNHWKTTMSNRAMAVLGEPGTMTVYGSRQETHRMLMDHLTSESPTKTSGRGRELWEWKAQPGRDNHWMDCLSLAGVGASMLGCALKGVIGFARPQTRTTSFKEMQQKRQLKGSA